MLGKDEEFVLERLKSFIKNEETVKSQEDKLDSLKDDIENIKEENYYLKNKLDNKRDIIDDMEIELNGYERKCEDAKEAVILKEIEVDELERVISQQTEEIIILKDNSQSMLAQIKENVTMEKKIGIQNGVISELKERLNNINKKETVVLADKSDEIEQLLTEIKQMEETIAGKERQLETIKVENYQLQEKLLKMEAYARNE